MKDKANKKQNVKPLFLSTILVAGAYVVIQYFAIGSFFSAGVWMIVGSVLTVFGEVSTVSIPFAYATPLLVLIAPALIIGFFLAIFKQSYAFRIAFLSSMMAYFIASLFTFLAFYVPTIKLVIYFVTMAIAYVLSLLIIKKISRPLIVWAMIIGFAAVNVIVVPMITNATVRPIAEKRQMDELSSALDDLRFIVYYPTYIPDGLTATDAKLEGYHNTSYQHKHVSYEIGKVEVMISEKLKNQESVFNKKDNCDISAIWLEMRTKDEITQNRAQKSRDNLAPCHKIGTTDDGQEVYRESNNGQFEFYYAEIDETIIVMQHDKLPKPRYADDFEKEIMKVVNSMESLDYSRIKSGY